MPKEAKLLSANSRKILKAAKKYNRRPGYLQQSATSPLKDKSDEDDDTEGDIIDLDEGLAVVYKAKSGHAKRDEESTESL